MVHIVNIFFQDIKNLGGIKLLNKCNSSVLSILSSVYPEHNWLPWKFKKATGGFWTMENQRKFMDWVKKELSIKEMQDWYRITIKDIRDLGGAGLLYSEYRNSPFLMLSTIYNEYEWLPWKFTIPPSGYWENTENQLKFLEWAKKELNIKEYKDWYNISRNKLVELGGLGLLHSKYNDSTFSMLQSLYPEYEWLPWKFSKCPRGYWNNLSNFKKFFAWAGGELNIKDKEDWYKVKREVR